MHVSAVTLENILLKANGNAVLADFDIAHDFSSNAMTHSPYGTPGHRSPQDSWGEGYSAKTGVYSLGCIVYLMLYRSVSFLGSVE